VVEGDVIFAEEGEDEMPEEGEVETVESIPNEGDTKNRPRYFPLLTMMEDFGEVAEGDAT
jgi:hypothetical protein